MKISSPLRRHFVLCACIPVLCGTWTVTVKAQATSDAAAENIRQRRESSNAAIVRHDTAGIAAVLAPHVTVVTSNSVHVAGRAPYMQRFAEQFRGRPDVVYRRTPRDIRVFHPWRMAAEYGQWTGSWTDSDGKVQLTGTYFAKWREMDGAWFIESETYVPETCAGGEYCRTIPR